MNCLNCNDKGLIETYNQVSFLIDVVFCDCEAGKTAKEWLEQWEDLG